MTEIIAMTLILCLVALPAVARAPFPVWYPVNSPYGCDWLRWYICPQLRLELKWTYHIAAQCFFYQMTSY